MAHIGHHARVCSVRRAQDLGSFACTLLQQCITIVYEYATRWMIRRSFYIRST